MRFTEIALALASLLCLAESRASASTIDSTGTVAPSNSAMLIKKGYAQLQQNELEQAAKSFSQALQSDEDNVTARRYLAYTLIKQSSAEEALKQLNQLEKPGAFDLYLKGLASDMLLHPDQAAYCYKSAVAKDPQNDEYRMKAIRSLIDMSKYQEASSLSLDGKRRALTPAKRKFYSDELARTEQLAAAIAKNRECSH